MDWKTIKMDTLPPDLKQLVVGILGLLPTAAIGRALAHHQLVRAGHRQFWSRELLWEVPTVIFCGIVGGGIASYFAMPLMAQHAVVALVAWMGPRGMEVMINRWIERKVK